MLVSVWYRRSFDDEVSPSSGGGFSKHIMAVALYRAAMPPRLWRRHISLPFETMRRIGVTMGCSFALICARNLISG